MADFWQTLLDGSLAVLWWTLTALLAAAGFTGCVLPYPGHLFVLGSCITAAVAMGSPYPSAWVWLVLVAMTAAGFLVDTFTTAAGAKVMGSSKGAIWCSVLGFLIGAFFFPFGLLIGPFVGAFLYEIAVVQKNLGDSAKSGLGALLGLLAGVFAKLAIAALMLVFFFLYYAF